MSQIYNIYLYAGFNNYYNRQVKRFDYIEEYPNYLSVLENANFNYNDGIGAEIVVNLANQLYLQEPDYCLVQDTNIGNLTRWFIMDITRLRNGQSRMTLRRDIIADLYNDILDAPCFIEKATLGINNNLIFNSEAMTYNQIKQAEYPLTDRTQIPWIVGYVAKDVTEDTITITGENNTIAPDGEFANWDEYDYYQYLGVEFQGNYTDLTFALGTRHSTGKDVIYSFGADGKPKSLPLGVNNLGWLLSEYPQNGVAYTTNLPGGWNQYGAPTSISVNEFANKIFTSTQSRTIDWQQESYAFTDAHLDVEVQNFLNENNKIYKVGDRYYQISVSLAGTTDIQWVYDISNGTTLRSAFVSAAGYAGLSTATVSGYPCNILYRAPIYRLDIQEIQGESIKVNINNSRRHLLDAPYDMFCIPYGRFLVQKTGYLQEYDSPSSMLTIATAISTQLSTGCYDIQLLPYCPLDMKLFTDQHNAIDLTLLPENAYAAITDTEDFEVGYLFWCDKSNFTVELLDPQLPALPTDAIDFKVQHETEFYRIVSPNYNGNFEIKQTSNRGLSGFAATCSYKPFTPYIKVAPKFAGLYGAEFGDARGLICGGDFSLPTISDAWENYQIQNKNYQVMFDRQIENMEYNNNIAMAQGVLGAITGATSAGVLGSVINPVAGIASGAISAAAGIADVAILANQQRETLDYTKDQFGYQLGNIKAQPQSLTKVSSFNADNKIFPFLEFYSCSETEKQALRNKLKYNGMTVMAIGTMREYLQPNESYIKGQLIRLENEDLDYHILLELATEINKGVFIK